MCRLNLPYHRYDEEQEPDDGREDVQGAEVDGAELHGAVLLLQRLLLLEGEYGRSGGSDWRVRRVRHPNYSSSEFVRSSIRCCSRKDCSVAKIWSQYDRR